jgi:hypothetical protein
LTGSFIANNGTGQISFQNSFMVGSMQAFLMSAVPVKFSGTLSLDGGTILSTAGFLFESGLTLTGNGHIGSIANLSSDVRISPGIGGGETGAGTIHFGAYPLSLGAGSRMNLNGPSAAAFDKIAASGATLADAVLNLDLSGTTLVLGDKLTLIDNTSNSAVNGTFQGLPEGSIFTVNSQQMEITYEGGDGNDVVVTRVAESSTSYFRSYSGLVFIRSSSTYRQIITLVNVSPSSRKPRTFRFSGLTDLISVVGGTKIGSDWYLDIGDPDLPVSASIGIPVFFRIQPGGILSYSHQVIGG